MYKCKFVKGKKREKSFWASNNFRSSDIAMEKKCDETGVSKEGRDAQERGWNCGPLTKF